MARWESSTRSLFVKTIWKDGHHHVVLQKEMPEKRCVKSANNSTRTSTTSSTHHFPKFDPISSVKLKIKKIKNYTNNSKNNAETQQRKLNGKFVDSDFPIGGVKISKDELTTLSDRVYVWLDLAVQNGFCTEMVTNLERFRKTSGGEKSTGKCAFFKELRDSNSALEIDDEIKLDCEENRGIAEECSRNFADDEIMTTTTTTTTSSASDNNRKQLHIFLPDLSRNYDLDENSFVC